MSDFFDYLCDRCDRPFCERILVMNLALDNVDESYCLECLAESEGMTPEKFYTWILDYVNARECFQTPWNKFNFSPCPRIDEKSCFCVRSQDGEARAS